MEFLWKIARMYGILDEFTNLFKNNYLNSICCIEIESGITDFFPYQNWCQTRLHHFEENELVDLDFADNITLAVEPFEDLQVLTANLEKAATNNGLNISQDETNDMAMHQRDSFRNNNQIKIKDKPVKSVEKLKYIVSVISANGNINDDINMKIGETTVNFKKMNEIWQFTLFSIRLQIVPFHSNVFPCLFECK